MNAPERHLRLLTETTAAVNSTLDLEEVLHLVAEKVADALGADACFVYLYDERTDELVLRATHGTSVDEMTRRPRMRPGEGITGSAAAERAPVMIAVRRRTSTRASSSSRTCHESRVRVDPRRADPRARRAARRRAERPHARAARVRRRTRSSCSQSIADQVAQSIVHAQLYAQAQRRVAELEALAKISEAVSESLYLEESLEAIVKTTMEAVHATGAALVLEDGRIAWPEGRAGKHAVRTPLRWKRRQIGELVADRDAPFSDDDRALLEAIAHHAAVALEHGRAVMRGVLAQEIHHRVKNNLQTVASLLRLQSRAEDVDPREALEHSVNRILAIAAVHEVLTEQRDEDVELAELIDRLRAMLVQGLVGGRDVVGAPRARVARRQPRDRARARLQRAAAERARARRRRRAHRARAARTATSCSRSPTRAPGVRRPEHGHRPLDRARARARRAARQLRLRSDGGTRAEVVFPA